MEIVFKDDPTITRMVMLYNSFGPPDGLPYAAKQYPALLGKDFYEAAKLNYEVGYIGGSRKLFGFLFGEHLKPKERAICAKFAKRLDRVIYLPAARDATPLKKKLLEHYKRKEKEIERCFLEIFGFTLPEKVFVAVNATFDHGSNGGGGALYSDGKYSAVSLDFGLGEINEPGVVDEILSTFLHELLHILIDKNKSINDSISRTDWFEEAVLDYFVPHGMLGVKLGLVKKLNIEQSHEKNNRNRPYANRLSKQLLPLMKRYEKRIGKETIWETLRKGGFSKYLNRSRSKA